MKELRNLLVLLRPQQWLKNLFIFLPLFFHGSLGDIACLQASLLAFLAFCLTASSIYCFNDIHDVEADRQHPTKSKRPIACGSVSIRQGYWLMAFLATGGLFTAWFGIGGERGTHAFALLAFYWLLNIAYCIRLKYWALIDVFVIASGFVIRILIGGAVTGIPLSHWIILMTFLLALFLAFAKRRDDVVIYNQSGGICIRKNVNRYNLDFMNQTITILGSITIVCYLMYTVSEEVTTRIGTDKLYLTVVFVLAGILRYMQLTIVDVKSGSPTKVLMHDRFIQGCIVLYVLAFFLILYV
ncbi:MAG: decaprenyl-phosphate phosphoribosyltransferase [Bacteroidaceae bacterium]